MKWGYDGWNLQSFCGATPSFSHAATRFEVQCHVASHDAAAWWRASLQVLEQLSLQHAPLAAWLRCAQELREGASVSPFELGWRSITQAMGCPDYPCEVSLTNGKRSGSGSNTAEATDLPASIVAHIAFPYRDFMQQSLRLIGVWLGWSHVALKQGRLSLKQEQLTRWYGDYDALLKMLPEPSLMSTHHLLWQKGIAWDWLGEDRTRIGEGARQKVVHGAVQDLPFDEPDTWHIPIYTVTGSVGKTTTARLLWQLLQDSDQTLALAASDGAWIGQKRVIEGDCIGGVTARALLQSSSVQAAVFEQGRGGIVKQGVPYALSDVGILLNVQQVHLGLDGIETLEQMADTKAVGLRPARLWVLNYDDEQCVRLAKQHTIDATLWFSVTAPREKLEELSKESRAAVGVERDAAGVPQALTVWRAGQQLERWPLKGVAPYQGLLGEKTLEELLAAVAAAYFGPLALSGPSWPERLRALRLDGDNHAFRTSVHRQGNAVFVLDKAGELVPLQMLTGAVEELAHHEGCDHRIVALCRNARYIPERHLECMKPLYDLMDEFVCFDRPESYTSKAALPIYAPGSIPLLLRDELIRLNDDSGVQKPVSVHDDWAHAEAYLRQRLEELPGKTLVLINQPSTAAPTLNQQILAFATTGLNRSSAGAGTEPHAHAYD